MVDIALDRELFGWNRVPSARRESAEVSARLPEQYSAVGDSETNARLYRSISTGRFLLHRTHSSPSFFYLPALGRESISRNPMSVECHHPPFLNLLVTVLLTIVISPDTVDKSPYLRVHVGPCCY
jgi:hypothetical protein